MHGLGNDYIYVDLMQEKVEDPVALARKVSDRHFGVGSDGLILIDKSIVADFRMDIYNADGSRAEMCGNGIRCVGKYLYDKGYVKRKNIKIETLAGIKELELIIENGVCTGARVDIGEPELNVRKIPVIWNDDTMIDQEIIVGGKTYSVTCVSMGNPHCVVFVDDVEHMALEAVGPLFENHQLFPSRINTEFAKIVDRKTIRMRVWERGSGETFACGTGASASVVAGVLNGLCDREATVILNGGELKILWDEASNRVYMEGPAVTICEGKYFLD